MAEELGEELQVRLGSTSQSGFLEAWRLVRVFSKPSKSKAKKKKQRVDEKAKQAKGGKSKDASKSMSTASLESHKQSFREKETETHADEPTVLDDTQETKEEKDFKRGMLNFFNDAADLHERVRKCVKPPFSECLVAESSVVSCYGARPALREPTSWYVDLLRADLVSLIRRIAACLSHSPHDLPSYEIYHQNRSLHLWNLVLACYPCTRVFTARRSGTATATLRQCPY